MNFYFEDYIPSGAPRVIGSAVPVWTLSKTTLYKRGFHMYMYIEISSIVEVFRIIWGGSLALILITLKALHLRRLFDIEQMAQVS